MTEWQQPVDHRGKAFQNFSGKEYINQIWRRERRIETDSEKLNPSLQKAKGTRICLRVNCLSQ